MHICYVPPIDLYFVQRIRHKEQHRETRFKLWILEAYSSDSPLNQLPIHTTFVTFKFLLRILIFLGTQY